MKAGCNKQQRHFSPQFIPQTVHCGVLNAFIVCPLWLGWCVHLPGSFCCLRSCLPAGLRSLECCVRLCGLVSHSGLFPSFCLIVSELVWAPSALPHTTLTASTSKSSSLARPSSGKSSVSFSCCVRIPGFVFQLVSGLVSQLFCLCLLACV